jgi:6-phosphogluconolactonase
MTLAPGTGALTMVNRVTSEGRGPAHVAVTPDGRWALAANYTSGTLAVWPVAPDGRLGAVADRESPGANAHQIVVDPSNRYVFVPCLGVDAVAQYLFDAGTGQLTANSVPRFATATRAGPRHLALHPSGRFAYLMNELDSTVMALGFDAATGRLSAIQTLSSLPMGFTGMNTGAEIQVAPSGRFVYASNRGHNSIAVFAVDTATGRLTVVEHQRTNVQTPRHFSVDPSGEFLRVANQGVNTVATFRVAVDTGRLTPLGTTPVGNSPSFAAWVAVPAP